MISEIKADRVWSSFSGPMLIEVMKHLTGLVYRDREIPFLRRVALAGFPNEWGNDDMWIGGAGHRAAHSDAIASSKFK